MTDILRIYVCSGQTQNNDIARVFTINTEYISNHFFHGRNFEIDHIENIDGVNDQGYYVHPSGHQYNGGGTVIIHTTEGRSFPVWIQVEYDPNIRKSHRRGNPHINLYLCCNNRRRRLPNRVHAVDSRNAIIILTNLVNNDEFSNHTVSLLPSPAGSSSIGNSTSEGKNLRRKG